MYKHVIILAIFNIWCEEFFFSKSSSVLNLSWILCNPNIFHMIYKWLEGKFNRINFFKSVHCNCLETWFCDYICSPVVNSTWILNSLVFKDGFVDWPWLSRVSLNNLSYFLYNFKIDNIWRGNTRGSGSFIHLHSTVPARKVYFDVWCL